MGCCEGKPQPQRHARETPGVEPPRRAHSHKSDPLVAPRGKNPNLRITNDNVDNKLGLYNDFGLWSPEASEKKGRRNSTRNGQRCPTCPTTLSSTSLLSCCPEAIKVKYRGKDLTVQAAVNMMREDHRQSLAAYPDREENAAVRLQRWYKHLLLYRRWYGVMFLHLFKQLDLWQERKRRSVSKVSNLDSGTCCSPSPRGGGYNNDTAPPSPTHSVYPHSEPGSPLLAGTLKPAEFETASHESQTTIRTTMSCCSEMDRLEVSQSMPAHVPNSFVKTLLDIWPRDRGASPTLLSQYSHREDVLKAFILVVEHGEKVPVNLVKKILIDAEASLRSKDNVQHLSLCERTRCVVVGDLHGQLEDLLRILREFDMPSPSRHYVFNGDFVDRGPKGCEVVLLLLVLHLAYPKYVMLNRGNHEDEPMCENYEFRQEALAKYNSNYHRFIKVFKALPLCTVIQNEVFVVHGGVPRDPVTLADINLINRKRDIPTIPSKGETANSLGFRDKRIIADMTWSDPIDEEPFYGHSGQETPYVHNSDRGNGVWFRKSHTEAFLRRNNLRLLIRSHEAQDTGFGVTHDSMLVTIFSASYYAGVQRNDGAVAVVALKNEDVAEGVSPDSVQGAQCFIEFDTWKVYSEEEVFEAGTVEEAEPSVVQEVLRMIRDFVHNHRHRLMNVCSALDEGRGQTGTIGCLDWCRIMRDVSGCDMAWAFLRPFLAEAVWAPYPTMSIPFCVFLKRYSIPLEDRLFRKWAPYLTQWALHRSKAKWGGDAGALFDHASAHHDTVHYPRFFALMMTDLQIQLTSDVVFQLFCHLDKEGGIPGYLRRDGWNKVFAKSSTLGIHVDIVEEDAEDGPGEWVEYENTFHMWDHWLCQRLKDLVRRCSTPLVAFRIFDTDDDGILGTEDLRAAIKRLNLTPLQSPSRRVTHHFESEPGSAAERAEIAAVAVLYGETADHVRSRLTTHDDTKRNKATLSVWPLSNNQLQSMLMYLDYDGDSIVTYSDFMQAFYVMDLHPPSEKGAFHYEGRVPAGHRRNSSGHVQYNSASSPQKVCFLFAEVG